MPLDGLGRRLGRLEAAAGAGGADVPCEKCGQAEPPLEGDALRDALEDAARRGMEDPHAVDASAVTFPCQKCGRPVVMAVVYVERPPAGF